jgi:anthranilate/para-aminobenzoate synthase component I
MLSPIDLAHIEDKFNSLERRYGQNMVTLFLRRCGCEPGFTHPHSERYEARFEPPEALASEPRCYEAIFHAGIRECLTTRNRDEAFAFLDTHQAEPLGILTPYDDGLDQSAPSPYLVRIPEEELVLHFPFDSSSQDEAKRGAQTGGSSAGNQPTMAELAAHRDAIRSTIEAIQEEMRTGECYLMNLTTRCPSPVAPSDFCFARFLRLWAAQPARFGLFFVSEPASVMALSPERFVRVIHREIFCEPIKGTLEAADGNTPNDNDAERLWANEKEVFEQTMVVDLVRNDLNRVCLPGTVEVHNAFFAAIAGRLLQMQSTITGTPCHPTRLGSLLAPILPIASVTGTPKRRVTELTRRFETSPRGYYTGMFGIRTTSGEFDSTVLIRSHLREGESSYVGVGAGITTLSHPDSEFQEFGAKLRSFTRESKPTPEPTP